MGLFSGVYDGLIWGHIGPKEKLPKNNSLLGGQPFNVGDWLRGSSKPKIKPMTDFEKGQPFPLAKLLKLRESGITFHVHDKDPIYGPEEDVGDIFGWLFKGLTVTIPKKPGRVPIPPEDTQHTLGPLAVKDGPTHDPAAFFGKGSSRETQVASDGGYKVTNIREYNVNSQKMSGKAHRVARHKLTTIITDLKSGKSRSQTSISHRDLDSLPDLLVQMDWYGNNGSDLFLGGKGDMALRMAYYPLKSRGISKDVVANMKPTKSFDQEEDLLDMLLNEVKDAEEAEMHMQQEAQMAESAEAFTATEQFPNGGNTDPGNKRAIAQIHQLIDELEKQRQQKAGIRKARMVNRFVYAAGADHPTTGSSTTGRGTRGRAGEVDETIGRNKEEQVVSSSSSDPQRSSGISGEVEQQQGGSASEQQEQEVIISSPEEQQQGSASERQQVHQGSPAEEKGFPPMLVLLGATVALGSQAFLWSHVFVKYFKIPSCNDREAITTVIPADAVQHRQRNPEQGTEGQAGAQSGNEEQEAGGGGGSRGLSTNGSSDGGGKNRNTIDPKNREGAAGGIEADTSTEVSNNKSTAAKESDAGDSTSGASSSSRTSGASKSSESTGAYYTSSKSSTSVSFASDTTFPSTASSTSANTSTLTAHSDEEKSAAVGCVLGQTATGERTSTTTSTSAARASWTDTVDKEVVANPTSQLSQQRERFLSRLEKNEEGQQGGASSNEPRAAVDKAASSSTTAFQGNGFRLSDN
ncbi:unnamed protein product [Amoebophrya sp. A25]|nr:unnamed protein product [Amoebophrya sp. A25]|eukprot:GSA25T00004966001.1